MLTHFIVSDDVERSRRFYTDVLGGETVRRGEPTYVALANSWIIINVGGGPTDDKPTVTLQTPPDPDRPDDRRPPSRSQSSLGGDHGDRAGSERQAVNHDLAGGPRHVRFESPPHRSL